MSAKEERIKLGLDLEDYRYDSRHYPGQAHDRLIDFNYVQGPDFSWRCPSWLSTGFDAYGAVGKCNIVYALLQGKLDYASPTVQDVAYRCQMCGACDVAGKRNLDLEFQLMLESLRARLVAKGYGPMPQHVEATKTIETRHNRLGKSQADRLKWVPKGIAPASKADILYFVGCRSALDRTEIARSTAVIMSAAKVPFMLMAEEQCCGHFVFTTGQVAKATRIAEENLKLIRQTGARTVVFSCAECYKTIKVDYPKLLGFATAELGFEVKHITELADGWIKDGRLKLGKRVDIKATYHDACNLARMSESWSPWKGVRQQYGVFDPPRMVRRGVHGVYQPPRDILQAIPGLELAEMVRHHESAWCCGNHGGVTEAFPEFASWTAGERMREAEVTGAQAIVSCCPGCKGAFTEGQAMLSCCPDCGETDGGGMKVYDITELVAMAVGQ